MKKKEPPITPTHHSGMHFGCGLIYGAVLGIYVGSKFLIIIKPIQAFSIS